MARTTAGEIARELNISRSYLYLLRKNGVFALQSGKWDTDVVEPVKRYLAEREPPPKAPPLYKTVGINNRRYLGNKYKLLPFIKRIVAANCPDIHTVADIFAGTGAVASAFPGKKLITNDNLYSNYICHVAWFDPQPFSREKIVEFVARYNALEPDGENYMTENFSDTYFSRRDCGRIGAIREDIEHEFAAGRLNRRERAILITSLLYAMDRIANTCGHYDAYRQGGAFDRPLELAVPAASLENNPGNRCCQTDANELVKTIWADLVYIDPPYNSRQYCDAYHLMENVARWDKPAVSGVARKMDRAALKSDYCTRRAARAFETLVDNIHARYILLSYNNMAEKGNDRSNAKITDQDIFRILRGKGEVTVYSETYKAFTTGKSNVSGNEERLFLCKCADFRPPAVASPLNYTGGKYKLLPQLLPLFPPVSGTFVDLFCGGCSVGLNVPCSRVLFNDGNAPLMELYRTFLAMEKDALLRAVHGVIEQYGLSRSSVHGYGAYGSESSKGLADYNRPGYLALREAFNARKSGEADRAVELYVLVVYAFNNQMRFNRQGKFNLPVGKRDFNARMEAKLSAFVDRLKSGDYRFSCGDFRKIDPGGLGRDDFLYADPPYLITCATYNERNGWGEAEERALLAYLDRADEAGVRFALSNVLRSEGKTNTILEDWLAAHPKRYRVIPLDYNYSNASYQKKDRRTGSSEVLIVNY